MKIGELSQLSLKKSMEPNTWNCHSNKFERENFKKTHGRATLVAAENTQNDASEVHGPAECGQITEKATLTSGGTASTLNSEEAAATCNLIHEATSRAPDEEKKRWTQRKQSPR